ncbi:MAG: hypothetical protein AB1468_03915 [Candidatus Micrarchaeota archaeon]
MEEGEKKNQQNENGRKDRESPITSSGNVSEVTKVRNLESDAQGDWDLPLPGPPGPGCTGLPKFENAKNMEEGKCDGCGINCPSREKLSRAAGAQIAREVKQPPITPTEAVRLAVLAACVHDLDEGSACRNYADSQFRMIKKECEQKGAMDFYQDARLIIDTGTHRYTNVVHEWKRVSKDVDELHSAWYATMEALMRLDYKKGFKEIAKKIGAGLAAIGFTYECIKDKITQIASGLGKPASTAVTLALTAAGAAAAFAAAYRIVDWAIDVGGKTLAGALMHLGTLHEQTLKNWKRRAHARKLRRPLRELYKEMVSLCKEHYPEFNWKKDAREFMKITNGAGWWRRFSDWFAARIEHKEFIDRAASRVAKRADGALNDFDTYYVN